jgi:hypothetical protein
MTKGKAVTLIPETPIPRENLDGLCFLCCIKTQSRTVAVTRGKSMSRGIYSVLPPIYPFCPSNTVSRKIIMVAEKYYDKRCSHWKQLLYKLCFYYFETYAHVTKKMKLEHCSGKPQSVTAPSLRGKSATRVKLNIETLLRY